MAKQKTLNKNLVAFLTVGGMAVALLVVVVGVMNAAQRDPEEYARRAKLQEEKGDLEAAAQTYFKAFRVDKDVTYLVEASRCAYAMGEISESLRLLNTAHAQSPANALVLETMLKRYWELRSYGIDWNLLRELSDKLLAIDPAHQFGLVARSAALSALKAADPQYAQAAAEALERAVASAPKDPRVTEVRVQALLTDAQTSIRELMRSGKQEQADQATEAVRRECAALIDQSLAEHPDDVELMVFQAGLLMDLKEFERCEEMLRAAQARQPARFELSLSLATTQLREAELARTAGNLDRARQQCQAGMETLTQTIQAEPAAYQAYRLKSAGMRQQAQLDGTWESEPTAARQRVLDMLAEALASTVGLKSLQARLGGAARSQLMTTAFDSAIEFRRETKDEAGRTLFMEYAKRFMESARAEYGENVILPLMEGQYALLRGDDREAIRAYAAAEQKVTGSNSNYERLAQEQLALLYSRVGEDGTAIRYLDRIGQWYQGLGMTMSTELQLLRCEVLTRLQRSEESLFALELLAEKLPNDTRVTQLRAQALTALGRTDEAKRVLEGAQFADEAAAQLMKASVAIVGNETDQARQLLEDVLQRFPDRFQAVTMYSSLMSRSGRSAEAAEFLKTHIERVQNEEAKRTIQAHLILLGTEDPAQRDEKLLELIQSVPDATARAQELYNFWYVREDWAKAATALDELEALRPGDQTLFDWQFDLALRRADFERAAQYEVKLTQANADRAGGAVYRGRRKLAQSECSGALSEFRAAERELPTDPSIKVWVAQSLLCLNETEQAITLLKKVLESDPLNFGVNRMLYTILDELDRGDEAVVYLEAAAQASPNDPYIQEKTRLLEERRNPAKGVVWREEQRAKNPTDIENLLSLVRLYRDPRSANQAKAEELLEEALRLAPDDPRVAQRARRVYAETGQREKAEAALQRHFDAVQPGDRCRARLEFAELYDSLGDEPAAEQQFALARDEALAAGANDPVAGRVMQLEVIRQRIRFLDRRGRLDDVIAGYQSALELITPDQKNDLAVTRLGILSALLRKRDLPAAEAQIAEFRKLFPDDRRILLAEAQYAMMAGEIERARELFTEVLKDQPENAWALFHRGRMNMFLRKFKEAGEDLLRSKELAPRAFDFQHRMELARLYTMQEAYELAEAELLELQGILPDNDQISLTLQRLYRGTGQDERAETFTARMIARKPENPFWHHQYGQLMMSRGSTSAALSAFEKAVELSQHRTPEFIADWLGALISATRYEDAVAAAANIPLEVQNPAVVARLAEAEVKSGRTDAARTRLRTAIRNAGSIQLDLAFFMVAQYARLLNREEALGTLRELIDDPETKELAQLSLKCALTRQLIEQAGKNGSPEALQIISGVLERAPADSIFQIEGRVQRALEATLRGDNEAAAAAYKEILEKLPTHAQSLNNLAYLLAEDLNRPQEALEYAERAFQLMPESPNVLDTVAWAYFKAGRNAEAESMMLQALARDPENLAILSHLGKFHEAGRQTGEARRYYQRLIEAARRTGAAESEYARQAAEALQRLGS